MTRDECRFCLEKLSNATGYNLRESRINEYYEELKGYALPVLADAVDMLRRSEDSFPSLRKVLEACGSTRGMPVELANNCDCTDGWRFARVPYPEAGPTATRTFAYPCKMRCRMSQLRQRQVEGKRVVRAVGDFESVGSALGRVM